MKNIAVIILVVSVCSLFTGAGILFAADADEMLALTESMSQRSDIKVYSVKFTDPSPDCWGIGFTIYYDPATLEYDGFQANATLPEYIEINANEPTAGKIIVAVEETTLQQAIPATDLVTFQFKTKMSAKPSLTAPVRIAAETIEFTHSDLSASSVKAPNSLHSK